MEVDVGFKEQLSLDLGRVEFRDFGEPATYTPAGGQVAALAHGAIIRRINMPLQPTQNGQEFDRFVTAIIMTDDVASPARNDKMTFPVAVGGAPVDWTIIDTPLLPGDGTARLTCFRKETVEKSDQAHRLARG
jgi:hypothetical protein